MDISDEKAPDAEPIKETEVKRTLETDIISFTTSLPYWGQYFSEKILSGETVTDQDIKEGYRYLLEDALVLAAEEKKERPKINIICKPQISTYKGDLQLTKLSELEGINALVPDQSLELCPTLTIVYGSNGSGKSGYIRLLNNVFITKGEKTILPNIHESLPIEKKALFEFSSNGDNYTLKYPQDCSRSEFKQFSVFDEKAVHAHLNNRNQFEFRPSGLSYFAELNEAYRKLEDLVNDELNGREQSINLSALFDGESPIKTLVGQISAKTKPEIFNGYKDFTETEKNERTILEEKKAGLIALKKDKEINDLTQIKQQLQTLNTAFTNINRYFTEDQLTKASASITDCLEKERVAATNSIEQFQTESLAGIGTNAWKEFIVAADTFARLQTTPPNDYPTSDDICLLCHQPISKNAILLIKAYWGFIKSQAEQNSKDAQKALETAIGTISKIDLNLLPDTTTLYKWLIENRLEDLTKILANLEKLIKLKGDLLQDLTDKKENNLIAFQADLSIGDAIIHLIDQKIKELQESDQSKEIEEIQLKITLLNHKEKLRDHFTTIETRLKNLDWIAKVQKAKTKINKRDITNKEKDLSGLYFNQAYVDRFNDECEQLNGNFGITINHTGTAGTSYRQLNLKGKQPTDILSEGEQKVISIADFLSETILSEINRGMVFDDPVTSLDEERKAQIAGRLVVESMQRQIIVFTHDLVFVSQLIGVCQDRGIEHVCHWIEQRDGKPGYVSLKNSPSYEKEYKNAVKPTNFYLEAKKESCPAATREMLIQQGFTSLRTCYETQVVFGLFQGVVQRFVERVSVESLKSVYIDQALKDELMGNFGQCCRYMEGHSHSDRYAYKKPKLEDLDGEIKRFEDIRLKIAKFNKDSAKG